MRYIIINLLTFLSIISYAQTNVINVDTNVTQVNINNYGTLIENNGGTVNVGTKSSEDKLEMPELGDLTPNSDTSIHFIYTRIFEFAGDKVKIDDKVYRNVDIDKRITGFDHPYRIAPPIDGYYLFKVIGNKAFRYGQIGGRKFYVDYGCQIKGNVIYVRDSKNCKDCFTKFYIADKVWIPKSEDIKDLWIVENVCIGFDTKGYTDRVNGTRLMLIFLLGMLFLVFGLAMRRK